MSSHGTFGTHTISRLIREVEISEGHEEILSAWEMAIRRLGLEHASVDRGVRRALAQKRINPVVGGQASDPQTIGFPYP